MQAPIFLPVRRAPRELPMPVELKEKGDIFWLEYQQ